MIREAAYCYTEGSFCQTWIDGQVKKNAVETKPQNLQYHQANAIRPYREPAIQHRRETLSNAITNDFYPNSGRNLGHSRLAIYSPQTFKCGLPSIRNSPKNYLFGMLRIIGGKTARKGQWPWQVAILNRFKVIIHAAHFSEIIYFNDNF